MKNITIAAIIATGLLFFSNGFVFAKKTPIDAQTVAVNNKGVGLMGQYNYEGARVVFEDLLKKNPQIWDIKVNLAIATFNRQKDGDEEIALEMLADVLKHDPENDRAWYCTGLLELYRGQPQKALDFFLKVLKNDPEDAEVLYFTGKTLLQMSRYKEALEYFQRSVKRDAYITSNYYGMIMALRQQNKIDEAMAMMKKFQKSKKNPRSRLLEFKYTKMGQKANATTIDTINAASVKKPSGSLFQGAENLTIEGKIAWRKKNGTASSITVCDVNHDNIPDLFITRSVKTADGFGNALLLGTGKIDSYKAAPSHPLSGITDVNAALWGDIDNNGRVDVYLCRKGNNQLWFQDEKGNWQNVTESSKTSNGNLNTVDGALYDADHDGDLDIFLVNADGPNELLNNDRNGGFRPLAEKYGLTGNGGQSHSVTITDLDADRDADIIVINSKPPHEIYINQLLWKYIPGKELKNFDAFLNAQVSHVAPADMDTDGWVELYSMTPDQHLTRWHRDKTGKWQGTPLAFDIPNQSKKNDTIHNHPRFTFADLDGDCASDIITCSLNGWWAASFDKSTVKPNPMANDKVPFETWSLISTSSGPVVAGWTPGSAPKLLPAGTGRYNFAMLSFTGRKGADSQWRSNASGIGSRLAVRVDSLWTVMETFKNGPGPGQSLQSLNAGLHGASIIDFVAIDWSDGVFQTELGLAAGKDHLINETQRQLSSCPVIFAWNGQKYEFVSDFLGVGGIGYAIGPGEYSEPRPWENFMMPEGSLKAKNGRLVIKLTEPMEEVTYMDAARLKAYDLPQGWSMVLDERMAILGPAATGKPVFYRQEAVPVKVTNDRGQDITSLIVKQDLKAAPVGRVDHRFIGMLEKDHVLTLTFQNDLDDFTGHPTLMIDGWVEYPYSQTSFAAWQAGATYDAPTVEIKGPDGKWKVLLEQFGYPAGMPRRMSVPLPELPKGTRELRIRTNQEIYWDRITVVFAEPCPGVEVHQLPLTLARMEAIGYPERPNLPQRLPYYDFDKRKPLWDTRFLEGYYTGFGRIDELVETKDNALAIFGAGEGIHFEFRALPQSPSKSVKRVYVLETEGWCKDIDIYTHTGKTINPLPHSGNVSPRANHLNEKYNTRYLSGKE